MMNFEEYSDIFKALSHPTRLKIACGLMRKKECNVNYMAEQLGVTQPVVSQHLTVLKNADIIQGKRNGNKVCYTMENEHVKKIIQSMEFNKECEQ